MTPEEKFRFVVDQTIKAISAAIIQDFTIATSAGWVWVDRDEGCWHIDSTGEITEPADPELVKIALGRNL